MSMHISDSTLDKYLGFLLQLDERTKRKLIDKLSASLKKRKKKELDINSLFGAWEDKRDSYEIIRDIRNSRIDKSDHLPL